MDFDNRLRVEYKRMQNWEVDWSPVDSIPQQLPDDLLRLLEAGNYQSSYQGLCDVIRYSLGITASWNSYAEAKGTKTCLVPYLGKFPKDCTRLFADMPNLLTLPSFDLEGVTNVSYMLQNSLLPGELKFINTQSIVVANGFCNTVRGITKLTMDTSSIQNFSYFIYGNSNLIEVENVLDFSSGTSFINAIANNPLLEEIRFKEESIDGADFYFTNNPLLTDESIQSFVLGLGVRNGKTLVISQSTNNRLSQTQLDIIRQKGWTIRVSG